MLQNYDVDITDFLKMTSDGLHVASFVQIKNAIIRRYKEAYGDDIDVSTATADGIFINNLALIMNNILQTVNSLYSNLNINTASGKYLDILCELINIRRKQPTNSTTTILIKNISTAPITIAFAEKFVDITGQTWSSTNQSDISLNANAEITLTVVCDASGPIVAEAHSIYKPLNISLPIEITQSEAAIVGTNAETDSELRSRRVRSNSPTGITVLESLIGALLNINGIDDAKVYNASQNNITALDNTIVAEHDIYVIVRQHSTSENLDELIGKTIYEKLTPGIKTTAKSANATNGEAKSYIYNTLEGIVTETENLFSQTINWKLAIPIHNNISITITPTAYFNKTENTGTAYIIADNLINYMNALPIGYVPTKQELLLIISQSDPLFRNTYTFTTSENDINLGSSFSNPDTYYDYTNKSIVTNENTSITITIS